MRAIVGVGDGVVLYHELFVNGVFEDAGDGIVVECTTTYVWASVVTIRWGGG